MSALCVLPACSMLQHNHAAAPTPCCHTMQAPGICFFSLSGSAMLSCLSPAGLPLSCVLHDLRRLSLMRYTCYW
jgi:hypothetical protein